MLLPPEAYPAGPATEVPTQQIPGIVADVTLRPIRGDVTPPECTPEAVQTDTAVAAAGPGPGQGSTLTELIVGVDSSLAELAAAAERCPSFAGGATGNQEVATTIAEPPTEADGVSQLRLVRTLGTGDPQSQTVMEQWVAQRDGIRLMVVLRQLGPVSDSDRQVTQTFFDSAVAHAFGGRS